MKTYKNIPDVINAPRDDGDNIPNIATTGNKSIEKSLGKLHNNEM